MGIAQFKHKYEIYLKIQELIQYEVDHALQTSDITLFPLHVHRDEKQMVYQRKQSKINHQPQVNF